MDVYNQQVFTFANSRRFETAALRIVLKKIGVDPYYTFNMKGKSEMEEYAVPIARILQERKEEARLLRGSSGPMSRSSTSPSSEKTTSGPGRTTRS
jgi:lysine 2,3-aminomutase